MKFAVCKATWCALLILSISSVWKARAATNEWIGPVGGNNTWSSVSNWSLGAIPVSGDTVRFAKSGPPNFIQTNSVVDGAFGNLIGQFQLETFSGNYGILVSTNQVLTVGGNLSCGLNTSTASTNFIMGTGACLVVSNAFATNDIIIGNWSSIFGGIPGCGMNLAGLDEFRALVSRVRIADGLAYNTTDHVNAKGSLILARTNFIAAAEIGVGVAGYTNGFSYTAGSPVFLVLGYSNLLCADSITVGGDFVLSRIVFNSEFSNSSARFRGRYGTNRVDNFIVADGRNGTLPWNGANESFVDFSSGTVDLQVNTLLIAGVRTNLGSRTPDALARGRLRFARGRVDVNTLQLGRNLWELAGCVPQGRIEVVSPGELVVNSSIEMGKNSANSLAHGMLSIEGGRVVTPVINADYNSRSNMISMTNGTLIVSNTMGPGIRNLVMVDSSLQLPATVAPSAIVTNLITGGTSNLINVGATVGLYSYPTQVALIKYQGSIAGAGYNFSLGAMPAPAYVGFLSNNAANSSVDVILDMAPSLAAETIGDKLQLTLTGPSNRVVDILTSTNLSAWSLLTTVTNTSGVASVFESTTNEAKRFFRARQLP